MRFVTAVLLAGSAWAQTSASSGKTSFDKAAFEATVRYYDFVLPAVAVKIDDPKPARSLPGFSEIGVHLTYGTESKDEIYFLSADGQTVIPAESGPVPAFSLHGNPFQFNLDWLVFDNQP